VRTQTTPHNALLHSGVTNFFSRIIENRGSPDAAHNLSFINRVDCPKTNGFQIMAGVHFEEAVAFVFLKFTQRTQRIQ
jgi:hypothetical protein